MDFISNLFYWNFQGALTMAEWKVGYTTVGLVMGLGLAYHFKNAVIS